MFGFGIDVPYVKNMTQVIGQPVASNDGKCGDSWAVQQMLAELGFYAGQVDGQIGPQSLKAIRTFAESVGLSTGGTSPKADVCQAIISAYTAKMAAAGPTAPSTTRPRYTISRVMRPRIIVLQKQPDGSTVPVEVEAGPIARLGVWWDEQTTLTKVAVVGGGVAVVGGIAWLAMGGKKAVPNRRRRRR